MEHPSPRLITIGDIMDIHLICARFAEDGAGDEILEAWDEWTLDGNEDEFEEKVQALRIEYPKADVRVAVVEVPDNFFSQVFRLVRVKGKPEGIE